MASVSGSYRATNFNDIAEATAAIIAQLTVEETRLAVIGGASTLVVGAITLSIVAEDAGNVKFTHKITISLNCSSNANADIMIGLLDTFADGLEAASSYTTVISVDVTMSTTISD